MAYPVKPAHAQATYIYRDQEDIHQNNSQTGYNGEICPPSGIIRQFIPKREIKINPHKHLCNHHDGNYLESLPIVFCYDIT